MNRSILFAVLLSIFNFFYFFLNLSSYIFGGDSAEYATVLTSWGIAHPPGYPLFSLLGNFFTHILPFSNLYHKVSFISFFFSTLSSLLLFYFLTDLKINPFISFFAVVFYLSLLPIWIYGVVPEVFSLAIFLIILQIYSLFKLKKTNKNIWASLFFLSIGLSVAHHHLFLFYLPGYLYFLFKNKNSLKIIKKNFKKNLFFLLIGLSVYLYVPITVYLNKVIDYENILTLEGFFRLITRASYGTFKAHAYASSDFLNRFYDIFSLFVFYLHDFKLLGIFFIFFGIFNLFYKNRFLFWFFCLSYLSIIFFFFYANFSVGGSFSLATYERFLYLFYFSSIFFFTFGLQGIFNLIKKIEAFSNKKIILKFAYFCFFFLVINLLYRNVKKNLPIIKFIKETPIFKNYANHLMNLPKQKSVVFLHGDNNVFLMRHFQDIYGENKQSIFLTPFFLQKEHLKKWILSRYAEKPFFPKSSLEITDLQDFIEKNYQRGFLIFSDKPYQFGKWVPYKLLWQYYPDEKKFNKEKWEILKLNYDFFKNNRFIKLTGEEKNIIFLKNLEDVYAEKIYNYIDFLILNKKDDKVSAAKEIFQIMDKFFCDFKNNYFFNRKYLVYAVKYNQCFPNTKKAANFLENYLGKKSNDFLLLAGYFNDCEKNKEKSEIFFNKFLKLKGNENYSLEKIR